MIPFDLAQPSFLQEAVGLLDPDDPTIRPLGGGIASTTEFCVAVAERLS